MSWDDSLFQDFPTRIITLQGTNMSPKNGILKMIFLFPRWDMLVPWRVSLLEVMLRLLKGYADPWETVDSHGSIGIFHEVHPKLMVRETQRLFRGGHLN